MITQQKLNALFRYNNGFLYWRKFQKKWRVRVSINNKSIHLGYFDDLDLAELVAIEARNKYHGNFACHV